MEEGWLLEKERIAGAGQAFPAVLRNKGGGVSSPKSVGSFTPCRVESSGSLFTRDPRANRSDGSVMAAWSIC